MAKKRGVTNNTVYVGTDMNEKNTIFGYQRGIENIDRIPKAEFNLLVSPWVSVGNMKKMEKKIGIPYLHYPTLPIGAFETSKFLREVGKFAGVDEQKVENIINEHENYYYYLIERYADMFLETRVMEKQFSVAADAQYTLGITKFLVNDLELVPAKQFIVDDTPKAFQEQIKMEFENLNYGLKAEVSFETDGYKIHNDIQSHDYHGYPLILGSYYEKEVTVYFKSRTADILPDKRTSKGFGNSNVCGSGCGGNGEASAKVELVADCRAVVCKKIGFNIQKQLERKAISSFDVNCSVKEALDKISAYYSRIDRHESLRK
ncbi:MAG: hypothetical protein NC320_12300 [Clostridium sp.]|nr:hypothetical protein [Clostridium sp.]